jgi:hypothetical protein
MKISEQVVMNASERTVRTVRATFIVTLVEGEYCVVEKSDSVWFLVVVND